MKRILMFFAVVVCLFGSSAQVAYASSYQPNYTEVTKSETNSINGMSYITGKWGQSGYTINTWPYRILIEYTYEDNTQYIGMMSTAEYVFNTNTLQFETEGSGLISYWKQGLSDLESRSIFVLLEDYTDVKIYSSHDVMIKGEERTFFPLPPVPTPIPTLETIVGGAMTNNNPMSQVISLIPLAISLVVTFLALRKALQMLRNLLSQA